MDDLVKRLRDWSEYDEGKINDAREEAADRIEALWEVFQETTNKWHDALDRIEALEAALQDIVNRLVTAFPAMEEFPPIQKARSALGEKKDGY